MIDINELIDNASRASQNRSLSDPITREAIILNIVEPLVKEAVRLAGDSCLVPPDGGSPTEQEHAVSERAAESIKSLTRMTCKPKRAQGDVWVNPDGWFGMSSEGVTGPWNNRKAAESASNGQFRLAGQLNLNLIKGTDHE